jgi:hypothetical protein
MVALRAGGVRAFIFGHVLERVAGLAALDAFLEHVAMTFGTSFVCCFTDRRHVITAHLAVTLAAADSIGIDIRVVVAGLAVITSVFDVCIVVVGQFAEFGVVAVHAIAFVREGCDVFTHKFFVKVGRVAGATGQWFPVFLILRTFVVTLRTIDFVVLVMRQVVEDDAATIIFKEDADRQFLLLVRDEIARSGKTEQEQRDDGYGKLAISQECFPCALN